MTTDDINEKIIDSMFGISRLIREVGVFNSSTSQITILQFQALMYISKQENVSMGDIANYFSIMLPTATTLTNKLIKADLVYRKNDQNDRRIVRIDLTQKGKDLLKEANKARNKKVSHFLAYMSMQEKKTLLDILKALQKRMEEENEK